MTGLFIDTSNLYHCVKKKFNKKVDYTKLLAMCQQLWGAGPARAYGTYLKKEAVGFNTSLKSLGFETRFLRSNIEKPISPTPYMLADVIRNLSEISIVVLASTDRACKPFLDLLIESGIEVVVLGCGIPETWKKTLNCVEITEEYLKE